MFCAIISPILRSTRLGGHQQAASSVHYTTSCKHSLVLLRMGETIAQNMLSWLKSIIKLLLLRLFGCLYYYLLPLALQPTVGFALSNIILPFFAICHQLSSSSHSQHLKISFCFLFPSFPGSSPSSRPFQFLSEDLFGHPILLHSL